MLLGKVQAIGSMTKFSQSFLDSIRVLMKYESLKSYYLEGEKKEKHVTNQQLNKLYQLMNLELIKMKNPLQYENQMDETRIVARIDELEQD